MQDPTHKLQALEAKHEFFIGIDSDGCVFDNMGLKHRECFCPAFIGHFGLQRVALAAREVWNFVNLSSKTRGLNRFPALLRALELLDGHKKAAMGDFTSPKLPGLRSWLGREDRLGQESLERVFAETKDQDLERVLAWSRDVNEAVRKIVHDLPPFPHAHAALKVAALRADLVVVSQTPTATLEREWLEQGMNDLVQCISGQEMGPKSRQLSLAIGEKYSHDSVLMVGDAPGDRLAAMEAGALFFPIIPGQEAESWMQFHNEALERFFSRNFSGAYEKSLLDSFDAVLPEKPPWAVRGNGD